MVQFQIGDHVLDGLGVLIGRSPSMMSICHNGALSKYDTFQGMVCALLGSVYTEIYCCGFHVQFRSDYSGFQLSIDFKGNSAGQS